ncbi:hypothetical protein C5C82_15645 [Rathayibacter sp. AY1D5]|nr:hypothetical protein C5C82_15645 [Rathayibacter sp. AY1D5]
MSGNTTDPRASASAPAAHESANRGLLAESSPTTVRNSRSPRCRSSESRSIAATWSAADPQQGRSSTSDESRKVKRAMLTPGAKAGESARASGVAANTRRCRSSSTAALPAHGRSAAS